MDNSATTIIIVLFVLLIIAAIAIALVSSYLSKKRLEEIVSELGLVQGAQYNVTNNNGNRVLNLTYDHIAYGNKSQNGNINIYFIKNSKYRGTLTQKEVMIKYGNIRNIDRIDTPTSYGASPKDFNEDFGNEYDEYGGYPEPIEITEKHYKNIEDDNLIKGDNTNIQTTQDNTHNGNYEYWNRKRLYDIKTELLYSQNIDLAKIKSKVELAESFEIHSKNEYIDLHFFYNDTIDFVYKLRENEPTAIDYCLSLCDSDIAILPKISLSDASIPSLTRKVIILEKQKKIEEAIQLCDYAIEHNYLDNKKSFNLRKIKLQKKAINLH